MPTKTPMATLEQSSPSKVPVLTPGDISPTVMRQFEHGCRNYFVHKKIIADDQVALIIGGIQDNRVGDWISGDRDRLIALSFDAFMVEFRDNYLAEDWEEDTLREVLSMTQGNGSFWDFAVAIQNKNSLLRETSSHLADDKLRHQINAGMEVRLSKKVSSEKVNKVIGFRKWLGEVKRCDDVLRAEREEYERIAKDNRDASRRTNNSNDPSSRRVPSNNNTSTVPFSSTSAAPRKQCPKLLDSERKLLNENEGCVKCRKFFQDHRAVDCPNDFPNPTTYKTLTQTDVDRAKRARTKRVAAVTTNASVANTSASSDETSVHPVAAVLGMSRNPTAYVAPNASTVLGNGDSDSSGFSSVSNQAVPHVVRPLKEASPLHTPHLYWKCLAGNDVEGSPITFDALIDHGSSAALISPEFATKLCLRHKRLHEPYTAELAMEKNGQKVEVKFSEYVKLQLHDPSLYWSSKTIRAIIAPGLCSPMILGLPFLAHNNIVVDASARTAIDKNCNFDLLHPVPPLPPKPPKQKLKDFFKELQQDRKLMVAELNMVCHDRLRHTQFKFESVKPVDPVAAIRQRIEVLAAQKELEQLGNQMKSEFNDVFSQIPHLDDLPTDVYCRIRLKDASKCLQTRTYSTPRKYREAWATLIQQHLDAGRIRPSNSAHASPAFIVPKSDATVLPRWVNDYRMLNANTILDAHPLPRVDDILADCAKGKIWSKLDMTNSFFQTRVHPDDVHLTAVTTPFGLYEWLAMPMGLRNSPPIHQRRMTSALRKLLGKICHIYLDDIVIWSDTVEQHTEHIRMVLTALREAKLYCNPRKCHFYLLELDFLGHHISARGIEANTSKVDKILQWPVPKNTTDVRSFLGLVRYISFFLPKLADYTCILTPLTTKDARRQFPAWTVEHQHAFEAIKALVVSRECLTTIDHANLGENKVFVTCDASDWRTGATLSVGPSWELARPVAFDSMQLKGPEKNYPVHEKELLAIIRALKKWRSDLLGIPIIVYTDHRTLQNFDTQRDLSRRQLRWQEFMSQYDMTIVYIPGEDNTVADALSRVPEGCYPGEAVPDTNKLGIHAMLSITTDPSILRAIQTGYDNDVFCKKVIASSSSMQGITTSNGLWYIGDRLLIPRSGTLREDLFRLAHDASGHFGADKSYATLRDAYYWPNMRRDLEKAYIPSCTECLRNKSNTRKPSGPLHPLPVPDDRGDSVAIDFIGPLPLDDGFDCILSMTDRLGSDIRIVPTRTDITAEDLAVLFFNHWYCENGLPKEIISDRDKLFVSKFWRALHKLTGVKLKLSSAYHPETDGSSERSNKTINQCIRYHVRRNQKGWVRALPRIRFDIMNSVNASTGFSNFQIRLGRSPRLIPPIVPTTITDTRSNADEAIRARDLIKNIETDVAEAKDNLIQAKVFQTHYANLNRSPDLPFNIGDKVMLSTLHRRQEYKKKGEKRAAKFFPRYDGPYNITDVHAETSNYTLELPNSPNTFPTYHASELKSFLPNDSDLFPSREVPQPQPVVTSGGLEEYHVEKIIDSRRRGKGWQYLVRWTGYGPEHDRWLAGSALDECAALDAWLAGTDLVSGEATR